MKKTILVFASILFAFPALIQAAQYSWVLSGSGSWGGATNWSPNGIPTSGDEIIANIDSAVISLNGDRNIAIWRSGWGNNSTALSFTVTIQAGTPGSGLTIGTAEQGGLMVLGGAIEAPAITSILNIDKGATVSLVGGSLIMGSDILTGVSRSRNRSGTIRMYEDSALNIGTLDHRSQMYVGRQTVTGPNPTIYTASSSGTLMASGTNGGGHLNAFTSDLEVGVTTGIPFAITNHQAVGRIDLNGMQSASIDTVSLVVGSGSNASAKGAVVLGTHSSGEYHLFARENVQVGKGGVSVTGAGTAPSQADNNVSGELTWGNGVSVVIGSQEKNAAMEIGVSAITRGTNIVVSGTVAASGGSFSGHFSTLIIGSQNAAGDGKHFTAQGVLDLRAADVTHFSVSGNASVGYGQGVGSRGSLYLANTTASISQNLTVGSSDISTGKGLVSLTNTIADVDGNLVINASGSVEVVINGRSSGISLSGTSSLSIDLADSSTGGYRITFNSFEETEPLVHGFAWAGNRVNDLQSFVDQQKISWTNANLSSEVGIFYDLSTDTTYIGFKAIPEPGSVSIISLGLLVFAGVLKAKRRG